jgi:DNA polymerase III alpha subunit (gram-positive type)
MEFPKDILLIDFEGLAEPVQIGAVLLDKETLMEKDNFVSYIWADLKGEIKQRSGISQETLKEAPTQKEVGEIIFKRFGTDIMLAAWVANADIKNFEKIIIAAGLDFKQYDYHIFDIWPAAYIYLLKHGYSGNILSDDIFKAFGAKTRGLHDALDDCRIAADVLRKITNS